MRISSRSLVFSFSLLLGTASPAVFAQAQTAEAAEAGPATAVHHAGGRHDELSHKAAVRAKQQGVRMAEPAVHPGGRHDEARHRAALKAQAAEAANQTPAR